MSDMQWLKTEIDPSTGREVYSVYEDQSTAAEAAATMELDPQVKEAFAVVIPFNMYRYWVEYRPGP